MYIWQLTGRCPLTIHYLIKKKDIGETTFSAFSFIFLNVFTTSLVDQVENNRIAKTTNIKNSKLQVYYFVSHTFNRDFDLLDFVVLSRLNAG